MDATAQQDAAALAGRVGVRSLPDLAVLEVDGEDARSWLNGQVTNDVRHTERGGSVYSLVVTVRGKVVADAWVLDRGDDRFFLVVPAVAVDKLLAGFEDQIIMEDVEARARGDLAVLTVQGPLASEVIAAVDAGRERA